MLASLMMGIPTMSSAPHTMNRPPPPDDGPTVIRTAPAGGPASDFGATSTLWSDSLPEGLRLGEYEIRSVIGEGGFGIVYLAYDHFLQRQVALKEYMPSSLAGRARSGLDVMVKSERHRDTFMAGLRSFVNEARLLAQFDHPALVKVYRFWEAHGTAYMVMPYCVGPTLKEALASHDHPPDEAWLRQHLLAPLMEALALLHKAQCLHRDIAPDNILLTDTGPLLLDFGAARQIIGDMSQTLTVVLKPGYAPIEQYGEVASMGQGAWTDLYALAGVARYAITGKVPVAATSRILQDSLVPLSELAAGRYSDVFLRALDTALAVKPSDRPQNVQEFQALLDGTSGADLPQAVASAAPKMPAVGGTAAPTKQGGPTEGPSSHGPRTWHPTTGPAPEQRTAERTGAASASAPQSAGRRTMAMVLVAVGLLALGAVVWWFLPDRSVPAPAAPQAASSAQPGASQPVQQRRSAPSVTPTPTPTPTLTPSQPAPTPVSAAPSASATPATPAKAASALPPVQPRLDPAPVAAPPPVPAAPPRAPQTREVSTSSTPKRAPVPADRSSRCSDILQKASLEPLSPSEAAFLKSECK